MIWSSGQRSEFLRIGRMANAGVRGQRHEGIFKGKFVVTVLLRPIK